MLVMDIIFPLSSFSPLVSMWPFEACEYLGLSVVWQLYCITQYLIYFCGVTLQCNICYSSEHIYQKEVV